MHLYQLSGDSLSLPRYGYTEVLLPIVTIDIHRAVAESEYAGLAGPAFHRQMVLSIDADASRSPSGENATEVT